MILYTILTNSWASLRERQNPKLGSFRRRSKVPRSAIQDLVLEDVAGFLYDADLGLCLDTGGSSFGKMLASLKVAENVSTTPPCDKPYGTGILDDTVYAAATRSCLHSTSSAALVAQRERLTEPGRGSKHGSSRMLMPSEISLLKANVYSYLADRLLLIFQCLGNQVSITC